jgi:hypothetical protein
MIGLVGLAQVAIVGRGMSFSQPRLERHLARLTATDLPGTLGPFRRVSFDASKESSRGSRAGHARVWAYQGANLKALVAVFYPYVGWHEPTDCFQATGWTVEGRRIEPGREVVFARLSQTSERYALAWFTFLDATDRPLRPPARKGPGAYLRERLAHALWRVAPWLVDRREFEQFAPSYQIQVVVESEDPLEPADEALGRAFFDGACAVLRSARNGGPPRVDNAP